MDTNLKYYKNIYDKEKFNLNKQGNINIKLMRNKYGCNIITEKKKTSLFKAIINALFEPMIIILLVALFITTGINIGNIIAHKEYDFYECFGIIGAIILSVGLTVFMEHKSEKAFEMLKKFSGAISVNVIRDGIKKVVDYSEIVVGDILCLEAGDKITADGVIIKSDSLECEESTLSGESESVFKKAYKKGNFNNENMVYSGTYVKGGNCQAIVLAVGDNAQIGKIAGGLKEDNQISPPLQEKLNKLSAKISLFGAISALIVFILTIAKLALNNNLNFSSGKEAFVQGMVLIVAAVPEGLPSTVAISLALSVLKLAKSNAVIKKLIATETVGCVSVICSDKTGTLTLGKMQVNKFIVNNREIQPKQIKNIDIYNNIVYNSTADCVFENGILKFSGNSTEQALLSSIIEKDYNKLKDLRSKINIEERIPFSSENKYMLTKVTLNGEKITFIKGSIEKVVELCNLDENHQKQIINESNIYAKKAERVLAFAHIKDGKSCFDGYCSISDNLRSDVYKSVNECKKAGIDVKILTGDNRETAIAIAEKLNLPCREKNILTGKDVEMLSDNSLKKILPDIAVIARSTPETKLRVVKLLKEMGEVVAVTGDGVNDAPAVKNADIGISMGDGSEITKEASDIILLDNSFSVIVKAVSFGRNIYRNFQRFLFFQLTVNFSAVALIIAFLFLGFEAPFNTLQLLWLNIIMDGPLALSLALEKRDESFLDEKPVKRTDSIVTKKMFLRIFFHAFFIVVTILMEKLYNFLNVEVDQINTTIFCMFIVFQLFNGINARETGGRSIIKTIGKNKLFSVLFALTMITQILITEVFHSMFNTISLGFLNWIKIVAICSLVVLFSEIYKIIYKRTKNLKFFKKIIKRSKFA